MTSDERVDPAEWFAKVESLEADLRAMTASRDNWQRKWVEDRRQRKATERIEEALRWYADADNYDAIGPHGTVKGAAWRVVEDGGERARAALLAFHVIARDVGEATG